LLDNLALREDVSEQFVLPINILPTISHIKISFSYHQSHNTALSLNKTNLSSSVPQFQSLPICVGSNNCNNSAKVFILTVVCLCVVCVWM
jgi:hypothetical protein